MSGEDPQTPLKEDVSFRAHLTNTCLYHPARYYALSDFFSKPILISEYYILSYVAFIPNQPVSLLFSCPLSINIQPEGMIQGPWIEAVMLSTIFYLTCIVIYDF